jgi:hypothetical protein
VRRLALVLVLLSCLGAGGCYRLVSTRTAELIAQSSADAHARCEAAKHADASSRLVLLESAQDLNAGVMAALGFRFDPLAQPIVPFRQPEK